MQVTRRWIVVLALVPAGFALLLLAGLIGGETRVTPTEPPTHTPTPGHPVTPPPTPVVNPTLPGEPRPTTPAQPKTASPFGSLIARIHRAHIASDEAALGASKSELEALIKKDPAAALRELLAGLRAATDEAELGIIMTILARDPGLDRAQVLAALTEMAEKDALPVHRAAAVRTLGDLPGSDTARIDEIAAIGRRDAEPEVREAAAIALGAVGDRSPGSLAQSAAKSLIDGIATETNPRVRATLVYAVRDTREPGVADALLGSLSDGDPGVRLAAADMLGDVAAAYRPRALEALGARFEQEQAPDVRLTLVTAIVRAGRLGAIPVLEGLHGGDAQTAIDDYLAGLRSGEDNVEKLFAMKLARERARKAGN